MVGYSLPDCRENKTKDKNKAVPSEGRRGITGQGENQPQGELISLYNRRGTGADTAYLFGGEGHDGDRGPPPIALLGSHWRRLIANIGELTDEKKIGSTII